MGIKTQDFVKNLPPKEITEGVDWFGILDSFDPTTLVLFTHKFVRIKTYCVSSSG